MTRLDSAKFLITICWENKLIQNKQYEEISTRLNDLGKMLYGWRKDVERKIEQIKTPTK